MTEATNRVLIRDVGRDIVNRLVPTEAPIFDAASQAYFANPSRALKKSRSKDDVLGFGLEALGVVLTPVVLHVLSEVVDFLTEVAKKAIASGVERGLSEIVWSMFRKHGRPTASILTVKQIAVVRERARVAATRLKLPPGQAELIADTIIAELAGSQG